MGSLPDVPESSRSLPLLQGAITLKSALEDDDDTLQKLSYPEHRIDFFTYIYSRRSDVESIVSYHLGLQAASCRLGEVKEWISGSFNLCVPVYVDEQALCPRRRVLIRFPLPYKIGEAQFPGNADEKVRTEAATFIWLQENCASTVPIPSLWGFGFPNGQSFTTPKNMPLWARLISCLRRGTLSLCQRPIPCRYIGHRCPASLGVGYLVMDYIEEADGKMLSESWDSLSHDPVRRGNLFSDLSNIMLAMARFPQPRIGSFTIGDSAHLTLTNRPLTLQMQQLENDGIPTGVTRNLIYANSEAYVLDLVRCHDNRLRDKPNSIRDEYDGRAQMAALTAMRALCPQFLNRDVRHGPFRFMFTDLHQSNIFVSDDGHVTCLVDLEWACSLPIEMLHPPYWLTNRRVDQLEDPEHLEAYDNAHEEFSRAFERRSGLFPWTNGEYTCLPDIMRAAWRTGNFWYFQSLSTFRGCYNVYLQHIQPRYTTSQEGLADFDDVVAPYWAPDAADFVAKKIKDKEEYDGRLRKAFGAPRDNGDGT